MLSNWNETGFRHCVECWWIVTEVFKLKVNNFLKIAKNLLFYLVCISWLFGLQNRYQLAEKPLIWLICVTIKKKNAYNDEKNSVFWLLCWSFLSYWPKTVSQAILFVVLCSACNLAMKKTIVSQKVPNLQNPFIFSLN